MSIRYGSGRAGWTVLELMTVVACVGVLVSLLLVAVQRSRETARRLQCSNNLRQVGIALLHYESLKKCFPPGQGPSFLLASLPYLEGIQLPLDVDIDEANSFPTFICPSDPAPMRQQAGPRQSGTNYAGNCGTWYVRSGFDGVFRYSADGPPITLADIRDGTSNTAIVSELLRADLTHDRLRTLWNTPIEFAKSSQLDEFADYCDALPDSPFQAGWNGDIFHRGTPWTRSNVGCTLYNHVLTPNRPACLNCQTLISAASTASSLHLGGVHVLYVDGHVALVSEQITRQVWREFGSIAGERKGRSR